MAPYIGGVETGRIVFVDITDDYVNIFVEYSYANRDFKINGQYNYGSVLMIYDNLSLKRGWNRYSAYCLRHQW